MSFPQNHHYVNLGLLILYPVAWWAPLMRAGLLPLFGLEEISVLTGVQALWRSDVVLALIVTVFAFIAPYLKVVGFALIHWCALPARFQRYFHLLGKLAMADIFLIALYITIAKGIGVGYVETAWGLYLFTACILMSLWVSWRTENQRTAAEG